MILTLDIPCVLGEAGGCGELQRLPLGWGLELRHLQGGWEVHTPETSPMKGSGHRPVLPEMSPQ